MAKNPSFNQSHFTLDYLSSPTLLDNFITLTHSLHSLQSTSLASLEKTYTSYTSHYSALLAAYQSTQSPDQQPLVTKTHLLSFNLKSLSDRVRELRQQIIYRETTIEEKEAEIEVMRRLIEEDAGENSEVWGLIEGVSEKEYMVMRA